jgi:hypothetical protein
MDDLRKFIATTIKEYLNENTQDYSKWKRNNVTLRGIKELGKALNEIGEGVTPFPFQRTGNTKVESWMYELSLIDKKDARPITILSPIIYTFKSDKATYIVKIGGQASVNQYTDRSAENPNLKKPQDYNILIEVSFDVIGGAGKEQITNYGEQFKILSTVSEIVKELAKEIMQFQWVKLSQIYVVPKLESGEEDKAVDQTKRGRLYSAYIQKQMDQIPGNWVVNKTAKSFEIINK